MEFLAVRREQEEAGEGQLLTGGLKGGRLRKWPARSNTVRGPGGLGGRPAWPDWPRCSIRTVPIRISPQPTLYNASCTNRNRMSR